MHTFVQCEDSGGSADTWINSSSHPCKKTPHRAVCQCVYVCVCVCRCNVRQPCVFTGSDDSTKNFLTFCRLDGCVVCTASSTTVAPLLGDFSILAYTLHSACDSPVHFSLCVSDTCFGNVAVRFSSFRQTPCRRIAALHELVF